VDNLTHTLVGAALARSGVGRRTPLAAATLILAANAPDVDVLSYVRGPTFALSFRRGVTHGVPALAVFPFLVAGAVVAWDRAVRTRRDPDAEPVSFAALLPIALIGLITHPLLDWMNTYGMRWWLPFDGRWSYGDALFIVDPWLWLLLGAAVVLGGTHSRWERAFWLLAAAATSWLVLTSGLVPRAGRIVWVVGLALLAVGWAATRKQPERVHTLAARTLSVLAALYVATMVSIHQDAARDVRAMLSAGVSDPSERIMIGPRPARPLQSDVIVALEGGYLTGVHDWTETQPIRLDVAHGFPDIAADPGIEQPDALGAIATARLDPDVAHYLVWSRFPFWRVARAGRGYRVTVGDMRYAGRNGGLGGLTVDVGPR
jgi:inner membrane protein